MNLMSDTDSVTLNTRCRNYIAALRHTDAIASIENALDSSPDINTTSFEFIQLLFELWISGEERERLRSLISVLPKKHVVMRKLAIKLTKHDLLEDALLWSRNAELVSDENMDVKYTTINILSKMERHHEIIEKTIEISGKYNPGYNILRNFARSSALIGDRNNYNHAISLIDSLFPDKNTPDTPQEALPVLLRNSQRSAERTSKYLFISGIPRSGTTALANLLNYSQSIAMFIERYAPWLGYHPVLFDKQELYRTGYKNEAHAGQWENLSEKTEHAVYIGDKRPYFLHSWPVTKMNFAPESTRIIHIYRNIYDVAHSYLNRANSPADHWNSRKGVDAAIRDFNATNRMVLDIIADKQWSDSFIIVDYSTLLGSREKISDLFKWLNIDIDRKMLSSISAFADKSIQLTSRINDLPEEARLHIDSEIESTLIDKIIKSGNWI